MSKFDPTKSRLTEEKLMEIKDKKLTTNLLELEGVGEGSSKKLQKVKIVDAYQLAGRFLMCLDDEKKDDDEAMEDFYQWYKKTIGADGGHGHTVTVRMMMASYYGLHDLDVKVPDDLKKDLKQETMDKFLKAPLTGKLTEIPGVGDAAAKAFDAKGIKTSWQLCGQFLMNQNGFVDTLKGCDVPKAWLNTIAYMVAQKCKTGNLRDQHGVQNLTAMFKEL
mmetsp:Transcript_27877/g.54896  ORF Transcript_27877/g.54896 Transcript_27877/m.54896 type:complete len:220 (+) Transcript_27877:52-711(+)